MILSLSEEATAIIKEKAAEFSKTEDEIVEWMVMDFAPSTGHEIVQLTIKREMAREEYLSQNPDTNTRASWMNGWFTGFVHFQTRKSSHPFKKFEQLPTEVQRERLEIQRQKQKGGIIHGTPTPDKDEGQGNL